LSQTYLCKNLGIKRGGCILEGGLLAGDLGIDLYMPHPQAPSLVAMEVTHFFILALKPTNHIRLVPIQKNSLVTIVSFP